MTLIQTMPPAEEGFIQANVKAVAASLQIARRSRSAAPGTRTRVLPQPGQVSSFTDIFKATLATIDGVSALSENWHMAAWSAKEGSALNKPATGGSLAQVFRAASAAARQEARLREPVKAPARPLAQKTDYTIEPAKNIEAARLDQISQGLRAAINSLMDISTRLAQEPFLIVSAILDYLAQDVETLPARAQALVLEHTRPRLEHIGIIAKDYKPG